MDSSAILKDGFTFAEFYDEEKKDWSLTQLPFEVALIAVVTEPTKYHILDPSMVILDIDFGCKEDEE